MTGKLSAEKKTSYTIFKYICFKTILLLTYIKLITMTAKLQAAPENILDENFSADDLHPADIEQILVAAYVEYDAIPKFTKLRNKYRNAYNSLVDLLTEKRGLVQFTHI